MRRLLIVLIALVLALPLGAQDTTRTDTTSVATAPVLAALDTTPATVKTVMIRTGLPEGDVRAALSRLWDQRLVRYRLVPLASGDTTASGRPRRERAYYLLPGRP